MRQQFQDNDIRQKCQYFIASLYQNICAGDSQIISWGIFQLSQNGFILYGVNGTVIMGGKTSGCLPFTYRPFKT